MSLYKRISATLNAQVERFVNKVENHEAIVASSIKQTQQNAAKTRAHLNRIRKTNESLKTKLKQNNENFHKWTQRAKSLADVDPQKSLQCLARRKQCMAQIESLEAAIKNQQQLESSVIENLTKIEQKLHSVSQQQKLMQSRQSVNEVNRIIDQAGLNDEHLLEDTFERWESDLIENESYLSETLDTDPLEQAFKQQEETDELLAELDALKKERNDA